MVGRQIHYMLNTDLGFKTDAIVMIDLPLRAPQNLKTVYAKEIERLAGVQQVSLSSASPEAAGHGMTNLVYKGARDVTIDVGMDMIDTNYMSVYGLRLIAGRNFYVTDTARQGSDPGSVPVQPGFRAYILNETATRELGFKTPAEAAGQQVSGLDGTLGPVVGVVRDFHAQNLHEKIKPFFFTTESGEGNLLSVKLSSAAFSASQVKALMAEMESIFKKIYPDKIYHSRFFDESLEQLYKREQQTSQIMNIAMGIAIFISCMGLFGLAAFTANQRTPRRSWHPQSPRRRRPPISVIAVPGVHLPRRPLHRYSRAVGGLGCASVVTGLRLSHIDALVDHCLRRHRRGRHCLAHGQLSSHTRRNGQSGEKLAGGLI